MLVRAGREVDGPFGAGGTEVPEQRRTSEVSEDFLCLVKYLVGGLVVWLPFFIFPLILGFEHHPNSRSHIFWNGVALAHQPEWNWHELALGKKIII